MIARIARRAGGDVEVGLIVYGRETVETGFHGPLEGRTTVADIELSDGALRVEQVTEKVSNGIGGLVAVKRSRPIFVDREADRPAHDLESVVAALAELIGQIRRAHAGEAIMPLVLHVTGGGFSAEAVARRSSSTGQSWRHFGLPCDCARVSPADGRLSFQRRSRHRSSSGCTLADGEPAGRRGPDCHETAPRHPGVPRLRGRRPDSTCSWRASRPFSVRNTNARVCPTGPWTPIPHNSLQP